MPENRNRKTEQDDLKRREYRDAQGNIRHHTKEYMQQHGEKEKTSGRGKDEEEGSKNRGRKR